ncbi:MAG: hypothetical protein F7B17_09485 [Desulfurococcales archaeon]|nr:hypothetical protein [Desulfurococcales archaeon]
MSYVETAPGLGVLALAAAGRALELRRGEDILRNGFPGSGVQLEPLLGSEWECEYFVDLGSRLARDERSGVEGFIMKAAVLERCYRGGRLVERILHPMVRGEGGSLPLLPVVGDERSKQAASYIAEIALALSLARRGGPSGGRVLVVRHGALLQQVGIYFNTNVYNMDCSALESVLLYSLMDRAEAHEVAVLSRAGRGGDRSCNAGAASIRLLEALKREARDGSADIVAVAEDLERTRYLTLHLAASIAEEYSRGGSLNASQLLGEALEEAMECIRWTGLKPSEVRYEIPRTLEEVLARTINPEADDPAATLRDVGGKLGYRGLVSHFYRGQLLDRLGVLSDVEPLMVYRFLYGPREDVATRPIDKGRIVEAPAIESYRVNLEGVEPPGFSESRVVETLRGFMMTYITLDPTPTCRDLKELSGRIGLSLEPSLLAEMVKVRHPIKLEYVEGSRSVGKVVSHIYTQAQATLYGAPPPMIVVDQWSRVAGWEASALRSLLESLGRRVVPYSTFLRTFAVRRRYMS